MLEPVQFQVQDEFGLFNPASPLAREATNLFSTLHATADSTEAKKQHAYAIIREEIAFFECVAAQAEQAIVSWKSKFNALANVQRLPEEILAHIFVLLAHEDQPSTTKWMRVTRVCSHWRGIALSHPEIWSRPDFRNPKRANEMIKRAKAYPLIIDFAIPEPVAGGPTMDFKPVLEGIFENVPKAKQIVLRNCQCRPGSTRFNSMMELKSFLKRSAPLLESLEVNNGPKMGPATFPEGLFSGNIPRLRQVTLLNWLLPQTKSSILPFSGITSLKIVINGGDLHHPTADAFLTLKYLPKLQDLHITNLLRTIPVDPPFDTPFELLCLKELTVFDSSSGCDAFFRSVIYPPTATIKIVFTKIAQVNFTLSWLLASDEATERTIEKVSHQMHAPIRTLKIGEGSMQQLSELDVYTGVPGKSKCHLSLQGVPPLPIVEGTLVDLLPIANLTSLVYELPKSYEELWEKLGQLPNLRSLEVHGNHEGLLIILGETRHAISTETISGKSSEIYFPSLSTLLLDDWRFWDASDRINENFGMIGTYWFPPPDHHVHLALLTDALLLRRRNKQDLVQITVVNSTFTPKHAAVVEEITAGVTKWLFRESGIATAMMP